MTSLISASLEVNSYQTAIQIVLEVMGTRIHPIPVICSITASPQTIAAILRSGAHPLLVDVAPDTLQLDPVDLQECLNTLDKDEASIVVLSNIGGQLYSEDLLNVCEGFPTILDTRSPPGVRSYLEHSFMVEDLELLCGGGRLTVPKDVAHDLCVIRNGVLGHDAALSRVQQDYLRRQEPHIFEVVEIHQKLYKEYVKALRDAGKNDMIWYESSLDANYFLLKVDDAERYLVYLQEEGIDAKRAFLPLHYLPELKERWQVPPSYPNAEKLYDQLVALPINKKIEPEKIVAKVLEVTHGG